LLIVKNEISLWGRKQKIADTGRTPSETLKIKTAQGDPAPRIASYQRKKPSPLPRSLNQSRHSDTKNFQQLQQLSSRVRTPRHNCRSSQTQQCATALPVIAIPPKPPKPRLANLGRLRHKPHHAGGSSLSAHEKLSLKRNDRLRAPRLPNLPEIRCSLLTEFRSSSPSPASIATASRARAHKITDRDHKAHKNELRQSNHVESGHSHELCALHSSALHCASVLVCSSKHTAKRSTTNETTEKCSQALQGDAIGRARTPVVGLVPFPSSSSW
jgi:hypothetical protein